MAINHMSLSRPKWLYDLNSFAPSTNKKVVVAKFELSGYYQEVFESPDGPIKDWFRTEAGLFAVQHSMPDVTIHYGIDHNNFNNLYYIVAYFNDNDLTYWKLKFE